MGNSGGRPSASDPEFEAARRKFCGSELESLKCLFDSLASQSSGDGQFIDPSVFQEHYGVHGALGERLFDLVTRLRRDQRLTFEDLVIAKGIYQMGSPSEIEDFVFQLVDLNGDGLVLRSELETVMNSVFEIISNSESAGTRDSVLQSNIEIFLNSIKPDMLNSNRDEIVTPEDFRKWTQIVPSLRKFVSTLLTGKAQGIPGRQLPNLLGAENIDSNLIIMKREYAWHISGALQQEDAQNWAILYHSSVHGLSFNTFMGNMAHGQGPTILLIKDTEGCIYGGYASQPWEKNSSFYGDMKSFLFTLFPAAAIYRATGANSNLQWIWFLGRNFATFWQLSRHFLATFFGFRRHFSRNLAIFPGKIFLVAKFQPGAEKQSIFRDFENGEMSPDSGEISPESESLHFTHVFLH